MSRAQSIVRNSFISVSVIAGGMMAAGCVDDSPSEPTTRSAGDRIIDGHEVLSIPKQNEVSYRRTADGESISVTSPEWTEPSPGLWRRTAGDSDTTMIVGAEGHRAAIAEGERRLADLRRQAAPQAEIEQQTVYLEALGQAEQSIDKTTDENNLAAICNFSLYTGPSSPVTAPPVVGAAALAQAVCFDGCAVFTSTSRVCTDLLGCTPVVAQVALVCNVPVLFGSIGPGTFGAACAAAVTLTPPGVGQALGFPCS